MATNLYTFNRDAARIEEIANELGAIAHNRQAGAFNHAGARTAVEQRLRYVTETSSPEGQMMVTREVNAVRREHERMLSEHCAQLVLELASLKNTLTATYDEVKPQRDTSTPAAIMLSQERWDATRKLLEKGRALANVVKNADLATALAIEAFAPEYLFTQLPAESWTDAHTEAETIAGIRENASRMVRERLTEIAPEQDRAILQTAYRAQGFYEVAMAWAEYLRRRFGGWADADGMSAAAEVTVILQRYGLAPTREQQRAAANGAFGATTSTGFATVS